MFEAVQTLLDRFREAAEGGRLVKLTLGSPRGADPTLRNVFVRPVQLRAGRRLAFVFRHTTRDVTRNLPLPEAAEQVTRMLGQDFGSAHLFTPEAETELQWPAEGPPRLRQAAPRHDRPAEVGHDRTKHHALVATAAPWLADLGVTGTDGRVRDGMAAKFRQIQKFLELLDHALNRLPPRADRILQLVDMGCGKGYLTFAAADWLQRQDWQATVRGVETRAGLVESGNRIAAAHGLAGLRFETGTIDSVPLDRVDVLVALHACDTATDDALARGIGAGAALILASPCCHKELRNQLQPPAALAGALRHGIFRERQAEFVTDALRAALLEWAGYDTRVFEFIASEHTAKNLMIAASRRPHPGCPGEAANAVRALAGSYGIRHQRLATQLGFPLAAPSSPAPAVTALVLP